MSNLTQVLLQSYIEGAFLETLFAKATEQIDSSRNLSEALIELHNSNQIDVIVAYTELSIPKTDRRAFTLIYELSKILSDIESSAKAIVDCIHSLDQKEHLVYMLIEPFLRFCEKSQERCDYVIENITDVYESNFPFLNAALVAGSELNLERYLNVAIATLIQKNESLTKIAVDSIGKMAFQNKIELLDKAFNQVIDCSLKSKSDLILGAALSTLHLLYLQDKTKEDAFINFLNVHSESPNNSLILSALQILLFESGKIKDRIEDNLLKIVISISAEYQQSVSNLDIVLERILARGDFDKAIDALEKILEVKNNNLSLNNFQNVMALLIENERTHLSKVITKWLLSGDVKKARMCFDLLKNCDNPSPELSFDLSQIDNGNASHYLFLAEKACGWFFSMPLTAMSLIVSLIDTASDAKIDEIKMLAFHPLLISYPESCGDYLKSKNESSSIKVRDFCKFLLDNLKNYHNDLNAAFRIKEHKPSEDHRFRSANYFQMLNDKAMENAQQNSLISLLGVQKSILLYGRKSIYYMINGDEKIRQEMPLCLFETKIEYPSLEKIDPHSLDHKLLQLRLKGFSN